MAVYYELFENYENVKATYPELPPEEDVVYAGYTDEDYSGNAIVVFVKDGKLYENNDGHCSCYGLEDWEPEETSVEALLIRAGWPGLSEALQGKSALQPTS